MGAGHQFELAAEPEEVEPSRSAAGGEEGGNEHAGVEDDPESPSRVLIFAPGGARKG